MMIGSSKRLTNRIAIMVCIIGFGVAAMAQEKSVVIRVVDGRNGRPISNEHVMVSVGANPEEVREMKRHIDLRTDDKGVAILQVDSASMSRIQAWVDFHIQCQQTANDSSYSLEEIMKIGVSTPNNCGSASVGNSANNFVVFARPAHWWEKMHR
jgi:hypothetical protein